MRSTTQREFLGARNTILFRCPGQARPACGFDRYPGAEIGRGPVVPAGHPVRPLQRCRPPTPAAGAGVRLRTDVLAATEAVAKGTNGPVRSPVDRRKTGSRHHLICDGRGASLRSHHVHGQRQRCHPDPAPGRQRPAGGRPPRSSTPGGRKILKHDQGNGAAGVTVAARRRRRAHDSARQGQGAVAAAGRHACDNGNGRHILPGRHQGNRIPGGRPSAGTGIEQLPGFDRCRTDLLSRRSVEFNHARGSSRSTPGAPSSTSPCCSGTAKSHVRCVRTCSTWSPSPARSLWITPSTGGPAPRRTHRPTHQAHPRQHGRPLVQRPDPDLRRAPYRADRTPSGHPGRRAQALQPPRPAAAT